MSFSLSLEQVEADRVGFFRAFGPNAMTNRLLRVPVELGLGRT